jgi:outer membrane protein OmpU
MKQSVFATTAAAALMVGGAASAQGIALFGDARLGLGYNIDNDGGVLVEDGDTPDDLRAISRVRFGVNMTGETDAGITFGAEIRADNAQGGQGGTEGQTEGSVFVSGSFGTLTYGDTDGADYQWVGDVPGNYSLTGLGDLNESLFVSNGGDFGSDGGANFADNPFARPTVRYDFDIAGFGISVSSNRDLTDIAVGTGYAADFGGGSWSAGIGYYKFDSFTVVEDAEAALACSSVDPATGEITLTDPLDDTCPAGTSAFELVGAEASDQPFPDGEQWSVGVNAEYDAFAFGVTYTKLDSDTTELGEFDADNLLLGASFTFDAWSAGLVYGKMLNAEGALDEIDGDDSYMLTAQYDLGGGASINGGVRRTYNIPELGDGDGDSAWIGDFGIAMNF